MTLELTLTKIGNSTGAVFSREALALLNVKRGDKIYLTKAADGFRVTASDPAEARQFALKMTAFEKVLRRYRNTFRELAK
jgi:putative addiction module antidote